MRKGLVLAAGLALGVASPAAADGPHDDPAAWQVWWDRNRDAVLDSRLPRRIHFYCCFSPGVEEDREKARRDARGAPWYPSWDRFIRPVLAGLADDPATPGEVRRRAVAALGRAGESLPLLRGMAVNQGRDAELRGAALLALGLARDRGVSERILEAVAEDPGETARARVRALASLALLGQRVPPSAFFREVFDGALERGEPEVAAGALLCLGAARDPGSLPWLLERAASGKSDGRPLGDLLRAHAVAAAARADLGRPGEETLARERSRVLHGIVRGADRHTSLAAIDALAVDVGSRDGGTRADAVAALRLVAAGKVPGLDDARARGHALLSLGKAAHGEEPDVEEVRTLFVTVFRERGAVSGWAALAMGLSRGPSRTGRVPPLEWTLPVGERLESKRAPPGERAAAALALGLLGGGPSAASMRRVLFDKEAPEEVRRAASLGLGLVGGESARETVRAALQDPACVRLRGPLALAAGLANDAERAGRIVDLLEDPSAEAAERDDAARALGWLGAPAVRDRLLVVARDPLGRRSTEVRAAAVLALGGYASRGVEGEWNPRIDDLAHLSAALPEPVAGLDPF